MLTQSQFKLGSLAHFLSIGKKTINMMKMTSNCYCWII